MGDEGEVSAVVCDNGSGVVKVWWFRSAGQKTHCTYSFTRPRAFEIDSCIACTELQMQVEGYRLGLVGIDPY